MKVKSLKNQTYFKNKSIKKPTDIITSGKFTVVSNFVAKKYGAIFSLFIGAIFTKYQSLQLSPRHKNKDNFEFWYTEEDSRNDLGLSYYLRKKAIKVGVELGLWQCEAKYNSQFRGHINKLDHFLINWDRVAEFFAELEKANELNPNADEKFMEDAINDEVKELSKDKTDEIEITNAEVEEFVEALSKQPGIKNKESYKLSLLNRYFANDKKTLQNIKLFLQNKKSLEDEKSDAEFEEYKYFEFYHQNKKYYIQNILKIDNGVVVNGSSYQDDIPNISMKVPKSKIEYFIKSLLVNKENQI